MVIFLNAIPGVVSGCLAGEGWTNTARTAFLVGPRSVRSGNMILGVVLGVPVLSGLAVALFAIGFPRYFGMFIVAAFLLPSFAYLISDLVRQIRSMRGVNPPQRPSSANSLKLQLWAHANDDRGAKQQFHLAWSHLAGQCCHHSIWLLGTSNNRRLTAIYTLPPYSFTPAGTHGWPIAIQKLERHP